MGERRIEKAVIYFCVAILMMFALSIAVRLFTSKIIIQRFKIQNKFTEWVWFDNQKIWESSDNKEQKIDWESLYRFKDTDNEKIKVNRISLIEKYERKIKNLEDGIENYANDMLMFRMKLIELSARFEDMIGWDTVSYNEYNGVVELDDGFLTEYYEKGDPGEQYEALLYLNDYCKDMGHNLLFVVAPYKISEYDDADISGSLDFSNQNADELLNKLNGTDIDCLDLREAIHCNGVKNHELFYKTDHHWRTTTAVWAAQKILEYCNARYGWNSNTDCLNLSRFRIEEYPESFLGSQGKKITLARTTPDTFELPYPSYDTRLHLKIKNLNLDAVGDYSVCYDYSQLGKGDYYHDNPYNVCCYGGYAETDIENLLYEEDKSVVIIKDSFGNSMIPALSLGLRHVYALDNRDFTGSVKTYIQEKTPDLVIVMYHAGSLGKSIDYSDYQAEFDFR